MDKLISQLLLAVEKKDQFAITILLTRLANEYNMSQAEIIDVYNQGEF